MIWFVLAAFPCRRDTGLCKADTDERRCGSGQAIKITMVKWRTMARGDVKLIVLIGTRMGTNTPSNHLPCLCLCIYIFLCIHILACTFVSKQHIATPMRILHRSIFVYQCLLESFATNQRDSWVPNQFSSLIRIIQDLSCMLPDFMYRELCREALRRGRARSRETLSKGKQQRSSSSYSRYNSTGCYQC